MTNTEPFTVYKLDESGREVWRYPARVIARGENEIQVEAFFDRSESDIGPAVFKRGDRFVETFYSDRWYNVFAVYDRDTDALKGWYCNVCRPAQISNEGVRCDDLALDVWIDSAYNVHILDEDDYEELEPELDEESKRQVDRALQQILRLAQEKRLPT